MPALAEWAALFGLGALVKSIFDWLLGRRVRHVDEAEKLTKIALSLVEPFETKLKKVSDELEAHKMSDLQAREARRRAAREHMAWDQLAAEQIRALGGDIDDPPPLFEGSHE